MLYAGTSPEYYGYTFDSGDQMAFFKPMLDDLNLQLCQDLTENTAEHKEMQYAAVWMADGRGIVQIGMAPRRLLQLIEDNDLQNVISQIPFDINGYMHVVDLNQQKIVASTSKTLLGYTFDDKTWNESDKKSAHQNFNHHRFCVYMRPCDHYLLIRTYNSSVILNQVAQSTMMVVLFLIMLSISIGVVVQWYLKHRILNGLYEINDAPKESESGDLNQIEIQTRITEFNELLFYINRMLRNIRDNWNKLSYIIDKGNIPMGIYEVNHFYHKTFMNQKVIDLFGGLVTPK